MARLAHTPYFNKDETLENPCLAVSEDGLTWQEPPGVTNPIHPWPGHGYNSDVELAFDPDADVLGCFWRFYTGIPGEPDNQVMYGPPRATASRGPRGRRCSP